MRYGSICSGIEAATVAWHPLGWTPAWFAEIEGFPSAVLNFHYPEVINFGDFTTIRNKWLRRIGSAPIDLLVGGTPCQSFSVAGKRLGLDDPRGNLAIEYALLARRLRPRWIVWENVPGVLSSWSDAEEDPAGGIWQRNDFDTFLALLGECGYGTAWRILDAQYFGVPQRRRRVFVVGHLGDWRPAAAVLFERESLRGYSAPRRESGEGVAGTLVSRTSGGGGGCAGGTDEQCSGYVQPVAIPILEAGEPGDPMFTLQSGKQHGVFASTGDGYWREGAGTLRAREQESHEHLVTSTGDIAHCLNAGGMGRIDYETETFVVGALCTKSTPNGHGQGGINDQDVMAGHVVPATAYRVTGNHGAYETGDQTDSLTTGTDRTSNVVSVALRGRAGGATAELGDEVAGALSTGGGGGNKAHALTENAVRRLTPRECERLQGFPDDYTAVPYHGKMAADGPRYKALGNSMAVPVMAWIGRRIEQVDRILRR